MASRGAGEVKQIIYAAEFCECTYEGGFVVLSLHQMRSTAQESVNQHKNIYLSGRQSHEWEKWRVQEYKVKP